MNRTPPCYAQDEDSRTACGLKITPSMREHVTTLHEDINCTACLRTIRKWGSLYPDGSFRLAGKKVGKPRSRGRHATKKRRTEETTINEHINEDTSSSADKKEPAWKTNPLFAPPDVGPLAKMQQKHPDGGER